MFWAKILGQNENTQLQARWQDVDFVPILLALVAFWNMHLLSGGGIGTPTFLSPLELALVGNPILEAGCIQVEAEAGSSKLTSW